MKAIMLRVVEASVAANGPTGVAFHIHQTVSAFHRTNVSVAQPNMPRHERREPSYEPLIHSRGTNPTSSVSPVMPSQPVESRRAESCRREFSRHGKAVCDFTFLREAKVVKRA